MEDIIHTLKSREVILLDANKTVGCASTLEDNEELDQRRRSHARGLYSYFSN